MRADEVALTEGGAFAGVPGPGVLEPLEAESGNLSKTKESGESVGVPGGGWRRSDCSVFLVCADGL